MAKIIDLGQRKKGKEDFESADLNQLLKRSSAIFQDGQDIVRGYLGIVGVKKVKNFFENEITKVIFAKNIADGDVILCGIYLARLLTELVSVSPESWWAIDYATSSDPLAKKKGGDVCFLICSAFPERGNHRLMDISYYQKMGSSFYYNFYGMTKKEIGYHMSRQFDTMTGVFRECLVNIKKEGSESVERALLPSRWV